MGTIELRLSLVGEQNESTEMEVDQTSVNQPGVSSTDQEDPATKLEQVRRMQAARRAVDAYVNDLLHEMMSRAGIEIPRDELEQGFEEFCRLNTRGLRVPDHLREWWNTERTQLHRSGPSEE
ncbi:hypothetical protein quinque_004432 [Culex quinquefasciatus]